MFICYDCSADLQNAIDSEDYGLAAKLRDEISKLEAESLAVSAKALAFEKAEYAFRLGQKLRHKTFGTSLYTLVYIVPLACFVPYSYSRICIDFFSFGFRLPSCRLWDGSNLL